MLVKTLVRRTQLVYKYCSIVHHSNKSFGSEVQCELEATPSQRYNVLVNSSTVEHDENQAIVVQKLDELYHKIQNYVAPQLPTEPDAESCSKSATKTPPKNSGILQRFFSGNSKVIKEQNEEEPQTNTAKPVTINDAQPPNGLYVCGSTGNAMLMDLFYESITNHSKQRVHFNEFMLGIHDKIDRNTEKLRESGLTPHEMRDYDPIPELSLSIANESTVLCFDEFQVSDIVDAVLLNRLFTSLFYYGVVCIATSNREPNMLYSNGLQRPQVFVPFLRLFAQKMDVIESLAADKADM